MPKQFKTYDRFDGGLNTKTSARSIKDNELMLANNVTLDEFGVVKNCGLALDNDSDYTNPSVTAMQPGYGLFQSTFDFASGGGNTSTVRTFLANADDGSANVVVHVLDATTWDTNDISLGAVTGTGGNDQGRVIYHIADGDVRICDTNITNVSTAIKKYGYVERAGGWSSNNPGGSVYSAGWEVSDTLLSKPTAGIVGIDLRNTDVNDGASSTTLLVSNDAGTNAFENAQLNLQLDDGEHFAIASNNTFDLISSASGDDRLITASGGAVWSTAGVSFSIFPPAGKGWNLDVTLTNSAGTWAAGTYEFASTFIYDGNQESLPFEMGGEVVVAANDKLTCTVMATEALSGDKFDGRITGGRLYYRLTRSDDEWTLLGDLDISKGTRASLESTYSVWNLTTTITSFVHSSFISDSQNLDTYQSLNGYDQDSSFISLGLAGEKYQTSVVSNRRSFIANIRYTDSKGTLANKGDTIRYSEVNRFDTFPELNFIDIGVNDGESFIKLEAFADRILAFKEKSLYIINIGSGSDTQWFLESEHKNMGVEFHAATVKTDFGIAWVNKNGLYFYDGSQIRNLQTKILESEWSSFVNSDTMIGYEPTNKHLVIIRDANNESGDNGDAYIYSFSTNSFTFVTDLVADNNKTNPITDAYNKLTMGTHTNQIVSYDGQPDYRASGFFDIRLKDDDFGFPGLVKKIYGVTVEYSSNALSSGAQVTHSNGFRYKYTNDSGVEQAEANGGDLIGTAGKLNLNKITFATPLLASSFQIEIYLSAVDSDESENINKVNSVTVEYRPTKKKVT